MGGAYIFRNVRSLTQTSRLSTIDYRPAEAPLNSRKAALAHKISRRGALKQPKGTFCCSVSQSVQFGPRVQLPRVRVGTSENRATSVIRGGLQG